MTAWDVAFSASCELGERPLWDERSGELVWVDIHAGAVHRLAQDGTHTAAAVGAPLGAAALREDGGLVLARGLAVAFHDAAGRPDRPEIAVGDGDDLRFNDGACDPAGRFIAGTCSTDGAAGRGALYAVSPGGDVEELLDGITESNGVGFAPDGRTMYYVDSGDPCVRAYPYDPATGALGDRRDVVSFRAGDGVPDGLVVDADGAIWVAMWEGGAVRRHAPDGTLLARLDTPVSRPTCPVFAGPALDRLYLTTAWEGMTPADRAREPLAGSLLVADPGATGLPALRFGG